MTDIIQTSDLSRTFQALRNGDPSRVSRQVVEDHPDYRRVPRNNYAPVVGVETGSWGNGMARFASGGAGMIYGQPQFFSPVHTPINWQIPSKRLEQYQWGRFFYENEPKVGSAIDFYAEFPMSNWEHECRDRKVKLYFDRLKKKLQLPKWCRLISHEVHLLGDCFPFVEVSCPECNGSGRVGSDICEHEGGTLRRVVILNPDYVEVYTSPLNPDPVIALRPDEELINMVQRKTPGYEKLSPEVRKLIASGQPIRLDNKSVYHIKYGECGYQKYGIGMVRRLFPVLSYKTKLMVAQWIVAERLIVPIKIVKVGSDERPAGPADIAAVQAQLAQTANDPNLTIVTHHAFDMDFIGACHDSETEVLTKNGWKNFKDANIDDEIGTFNLSTGNLEYQKPIEKQEYDYNGKMFNFKGRHVDACVTPNHMMLVRKMKYKNEKPDGYTEWKKVRADEVSHNDRFINQIGWNGEVPKDLPYKNTMLGHLDLDTYLEFVGYYLSEGGIKVSEGNANSIHLTQKVNSKYYERMKQLMVLVKNNVKISQVINCLSKDNIPIAQIIINDRKLAKEMMMLYGHKSFRKFIPKWILSLPVEKLKILFEAMMNGDGSRRISNSGKLRMRYNTVSKQLSEDFYEMAMKLGYSVVVSKENKPKFKNYNTHDIYRINICLGNNDKYRTIKKKNIKQTDYKGKVYCFTVPNGYIVTRRNNKISIHGNSGKVLALSTEFEFINQEILDGMMINNALLNGEGPNFSHSIDTRVLTNNGLKYCDEFDMEKDLVATFNLRTKSLEYQKATQKFEYDWNSVDGDDPPLKHFKTNRIDMLVTPNHTMLCAERKLTTNEGFGGQKVNGQKEGYGDWQCIRAHSIKKRSKFRSCFDNWTGVDSLENTIYGIDKFDFIKILGWYVSEGWKVRDQNIVGKINGIAISQCPIANKTTYDKILTVLSSNNVLKIRPSRDSEFHITNKMNQELVQYLSNNCGDYANTKCIPQDIKNLPCNYLRILLDALVEGDGSERPATKKKQTDKKYYSYTTVSTQLRDDVIEILFKLGYSPRFNVIKFDTPNLQTQYTISWSDTENGKFPVLDSRKWDNKLKSCNSKSEQVIFDEDYVGKVWCVEVPNHFIVTERNGLFGIHGNSSAAVGIEAMIQRLTTFREQITEWLENCIYIPEARRQGFIEENPETGEEEVLIPKIKWNSMHLRDQQQYRQFVMQLYEKGLLSAQTVLEVFDFDPDQEIERKRYDALQMAALGQGQPGGDASGGMGGGGGMGGLPPPMGGGGDAPIGAPGGDMGGAPGEGPSAPAGGGPAISKSSSIVAEVADPSQFGGRVLRKNTREKIVSDQAHKQKLYEQQQKRVQDSNDPSKPIRDEKGRIIFTKAERNLFPHLLKAKNDGLFGNIVLQPQFRVSSGDSEYAIDFAFPQLKIGVEADGEIFHSSPKQATHDKERDMKLAQQGWTILRFTDTEIEKKAPQILQEVIKVVMQKQLTIQNLSKNKKVAEQGLDLGLRVNASEEMEENSENFEVIDSEDSQDPQDYQSPIQPSELPDNQ